MAEDLMRYDLLAQEALRGVVRAALRRVVREGLPGEHHFYIAFLTTFPGVEISHRLREKYEREMTIVLQHQFWDLIVTEEYFSVALSFNDVPETLHVPFAAVKGFFDPSVQFGLQFETDEEAARAAEAEKTTKLEVKSDNKSDNKAETKAENKSDSQGTDDEAETEEAAPKVVSLDSFRKK